MTPLHYCDAVNVCADEVYVTAYGQDWVLTVDEVSDAVAACLVTGARAQSSLSDLIAKGVRECGFAASMLTDILEALGPADEQAWRDELAREPLHWVQPGEEVGE